MVICPPILGGCYNMLPPYNANISRVKLNTERRLLNFLKVLSLRKTSICELLSAAVGCTFIILSEAVTP